MIPADAWVLGFCGFAALCVLLALLGNIAHERAQERRWNLDRRNRRARQRAAESRVRFR